MPNKKMRGATTFGPFITQATNSIQRFTRALWTEEILQLFDARQKSSKMLHAKRKHFQAIHNRNGSTTQRFTRAQWSEESLSTFSAQEDFFRNDQQTRRGNISERFIAQTEHTTQNSIRALWSEGSLLVFEAQQYPPQYPNKQTDKCDEEPFSGYS